MAQPVCTDQEFIGIWKNLQSPSLVSKHLKISMRHTLSRRRRLELRYGIVLPIAHGKNVPPNKVTKGIDYSGAVAKYQIQNGRILIGSDAHIWPGERTTMQRGFLHLAELLKPECIVVNGDFFDGARLSRFASIGWENKPDVWQELEAVADYLKDLEAAAPKAHRVWPVGNHDIRFESRIANLVPELAKVQGMHLKDHLPNWLPCWRLDVNDDIVIRHRELGGEHADFRNVQTSGKTICTGHDHRIGVVFYRDYTGLRFGVRSGFMCDSPLDPQFVHYLEGKEPNWWPGCVVLTFKDGRLLMPELCIRHEDGQVQWRGEIIDV